MERLRCVTCGTYIAIGNGSVKFPCPGCGEIIGRCTRCRDLSRRFVSRCGFEGP